MKYSTFCQSASGHNCPRVAKHAIDKFVKPEWKCLDLGCGLGDKLKMLPPGSIGIDALFEMPGVVFKGDMHDVSEVLKGSAPLDCVFMNQVYEHSVAPAVLLLEINKVLKKGGFLLNITPGYTQKWVEDQNHLIVPTPVQFIELARKCGFRLVEHYPMREAENSNDFDSVMNVFFVEKIKNFEELPFG